MLGGVLLAAIEIIPEVLQQVRLHEALSQVSVSLALEQPLPATPNDSASSAAKCLKQTSPSHAPESNATMRRCCW